jgi:cytochrome P450
MPHRFPAELGWKHGGLARFRVLHRAFLAVTHPDYAAHILITRHERYARSFHYRNQQVFVGKGLISTDGEGWLKRRRQVLPAFRPEQLRRIVPTTCTATAALLDRWEQERRRALPVPVVADMRRLTMAVIGRALLSADLEDAQAAQFGQAVADALWLIRERNTSVVRAPLAIPTRHNRRLHETRAILDRYVNRHLAQRRDSPDLPDILGRLCQAHDPDTGERLTHQELLDETKTLFVAGFETTATALAWTLYLLARHPTAAERWHEEIEHVLHGSPPTWEDLDKLTWTAQVINESLRLYPPVYNLARECIADDEVDGRAVPRGTVAVISIYGIHRGAAWWNDAHVFRPERFDASRDWPRHAFLPFGAGKHLCMGAGFSLVEIKLILAMIGQRYRLKLARDAEVGETARITLAPAGEVLVALKPRA